MEGQLTARITESMMSGTADASVASFIKLSMGINQPARAAIGMEIGGRGGIAWADEGAPGNVAAVNFLNGRIMAIAGGSNQIQRNIISERILGLPREPTVDSDRSFREVLADAKNWGGKGSRR